MSRVAAGTRASVARRPAAGMASKGGDAEGAGVVWDSARRRFRTADSQAYLVYALADDGVLDLQHTFVPASLRGGGVAAHLCRAAFEHADAHGLRVRPSCSYVSDTFLPRHAHWQRLVLVNDGAAGKTPRSGL